ncbi:Cytochrome P450 71A9 [Apostasia shenzhenica]|uniref:Cytochrome P450 71A9 n=1 Tax=Apostasia shenzhenica TaxID=1088818 RepID=A0A2I0ACZ9_9ASPA|nr:Cytochrome P450 71A9 [Apostasia shenzhenica]
MDFCSIFFLCFLFASSLLLLLRKRRRQNISQKKRLPPQPWRLPIVGNLHQLDPNRPHRSLLKLSQRHGPIMLLQLGSVPTLVVSSGEVVREIFRHNDLIFSGRPPMRAAVKLFYNLCDVAFSPYGEFWRQARRISVHELLSAKQVRRFEAVRQQEVAKLVTAINGLCFSSSSSSSNSHLVNLSKLTLSLSNNVVCRVLLGGEYGGEGGYGGGGSGWLHEVLPKTQQLLAELCVGDLIPWMGWVDRLTRLDARLKNTFEEFDRFYDMVIEEHMKKGEDDEEEEEEEDMLKLLLRLRKRAEPGGFLSSMDHVKGILMDMFVAGTDTSAATITWTMAELIKNPKVMSKLLEELRRVIGNKSKMIEENELEKLEYLKLVVKESLRVHPAAPLLVPRETIEPCTIYGYHVPAKSRVIINATAMALDARVWENPHDFCPERFSDGKMDFRGRHYEYIPFGAGRRICPGINFALPIVELALANLLHCFEWALPHGMTAEDMNMEEALGITMHKKVPLCLAAKSKSEETIIS